MERYFREFSLDKDYTILKVFMKNKKYIYIHISTMKMEEGKTSFIGYQENMYT